MQQYLDLMRHVLEHGSPKADRTGTGTRSVFGWQMRFDLGAGFPVLTTKKLHLRSIIHELLWFLQGDTNIRYLQENGVRIWDEWADRNGDLGPVYGHQWRHWRTPDGREIDQIAQLVDGLKNNPDSRRHLVTAWNPGDVERMALPPCHAFFQLYVARQPRPIPTVARSFPASCTSAAPTSFLAYPSTSLHTPCDLDAGAGLRLPAWATSCIPLAMRTSTAITLQQARLQLTRATRTLPTMRLNPGVRDLFSFRFEDFTLEGYDPHPHIAAPVAV
jgi:thymidylate synthase